MHRLALLIVATAAACSTSNRPRNEPMLDPLRPLGGALVAPGVDLTGTWMTGTEREPSEREIVLRPQCNYSPAVWIIHQAGDTVHARALPGRYAQGTRATPVSMTAAIGRISGLAVRLEMPGLHYALRYDSTSGHLRGTLNGGAFWAIRQKVIPPPGCLPPPARP
jgi:hypothetical protein